jgi:hypothetical protein
MKKGFYKIAIVFIFSVLIIFGTGYRTSLNDRDVFNKPEETIKKNIETQPVETKITEKISTPPAIEINLQKTAPIILDVPFITQAPFGEWNDQRQQDGCEETAAIMAMAWVQGKKLTKEQAKKELYAIAEFELKNFGNFVDTSASATVEIIFRNYFKYNKAEAKYNILKQDIINELYKGNLVIVPVNGQTVGSPYYTPPGPERHMILIIGYDQIKKEFITNDQGTKHGQKYRYKEDILFKAIRDYPSGDHEPIISIKKALIVVWK